MINGAAAIALSGWGQPHDALRAVLPEATHMAYAHCESACHALEQVRARAEACRLAVGWSLGGQLLVRATAAGMIRPDRLVLIATPYQFVRREQAGIGMPPDLFTLFYDNYAADPQRTLTKAWATLVKGDRYAAQVRRVLEATDRQILTRLPWLSWLSELQRFSCDGLHMADFPRTLLIHGSEDAVVYPAQSLMIKQAIPHAELLIIDGCGHAPHWHDSEKIRQAIADFAGGTRHV